MKVVALLACALLPAAPSFAAPDPVATEQYRLLKGNRSAQFRSEATHSEPIARLPAHVPAPEGQVTMWADFSHAGEKLVVALYLINRTDAAKSFGSEGTDLGIALEYNKGGAWRRAQALPPAGWCGDGHQMVDLPAGHFFRLRGYRPAAGMKATVRYALSNQRLHSNEAIDVVSPVDLKAVDWDTVTEAAIPLEIRSLLYIDPSSPLPALPSLPKRTNAVKELARYPRSEAIIARVRLLRDSLPGFPQGPHRSALAHAVDAYLVAIEDPETPRSAVDSSSSGSAPPQQATAPPSRSAKSR